jgi:hypothetical protein
MRSGSDRAESGDLPGGAPRVVTADEAGTGCTNAALVAASEYDGTKTFASLRLTLVAAAVRPVSRQQSRSRAAFTTALTASEADWAAVA